MAHILPPAAGRVLSTGTHTTVHSGQSRTVIAQLLSKVGLDTIVIGEKTAGNV
jgi:hypothetical protein